MHANSVQGGVWWHCCDISGSIVLFFPPAVFHAILIPFIPFQQMSDECYDKAFIPNIIDSSHLLWKGSGPLIGQVGSMSHLCVFRLPQMSSAMWSHHLRKLSALIAGREEWGHRPAHCCSYHTGAEMCCNETDMLIRATVTRYLSVRFRWLDCGILNLLQCQSLLDYLLDQSKLLLRVYMHVQ